MTAEVASVTPMPTKVAAAISAVMKSVPKLAKSEKNTHGNYNFASIDDFLEAVRPLCAEHGLIIMQDEESFEMRDGWLVMTFSFMLAHSSGETWDHRLRRTIMVSSKMGSQAFGAAQSYALKQFERALFQIATGEKGQDADEHPPSDLPKGAKTKTSRDLDWHGPMTKTQLSTDLRDFTNKRLPAVADIDELQALLDEYDAVLVQCRKDLPGWWTGAGMPEDFVPIQKRIADRRGALANGNGAATDTIEISVPDRPGLIKVPKPPEGATMGAVWRAWSTAMANVITSAPSVAVLDIWLTENKVPLDSLRHYSATGTQWADALNAKAEERRKALTNDPRYDEARKEGEAA